MIQGHFIVIEGIDGAGTSTQADLLAQWLRERELPVCATTEPTTGPIGALIHQVLTHRLVTPGVTGPRPMSWATMALLFAADRVDHVDSVIMPNLMDGVTVVCDRYDLSSIIYQSALGTGLDVSPESISAPIMRHAEADNGFDPHVLDWVRTLNSRAPRPDLTIVVDVEPHLALQRRQKRMRGTELYEDNTLQTALAKAYLAAETYAPNDFIVHVNGNAPARAVHEQIIRHVAELRHE